MPCNGTRLIEHCKRRTTMVALDRGQGTLRRRCRKQDVDRQGARSSLNSTPALMESLRMRMRRQLRRQFKE
ncbi:hypothetical protein LINPERPRIM_LOCUS39588 [Linum perenne]